MFPRRRQEDYISYTCGKTHLPILSGDVWGDDQPERCKAVLVAADGLLLRGLYDGHGRLGGRNIRPFMAAGAKLVLEAFYSGEAWQELDTSHPDPGLGFFHDNSFLDQIFSGRGYQSFDEYRRAYFVHEASIGGLQRMVQEVCQFGSAGGVAVQVA